MKKVFSLVKLSLFSLSVVLLISPPAMAYIGPGAGLAALGAFIALLVAILAALFGFLWFPVKRLLKRRKEARSDLDQTAQGRKE